MKTDDKNPSADTKTDQGYNGWTNYETWIVDVWLTSDQGLYEYVRELKEQYTSKYDLGEAIKAFIEESSPLAEEASMYSDILNGALSVVSWYELAADLLDN